MAQPTNTFSSYDAVGNREDLKDTIYNIDPTDTLFMSSISTSSADSTKHEWQTDSLTAASGANAVIEGDDATTDAAAASTRVFNYTQISDKVARVTGTQGAVIKAGRRDEMAYQVTKRVKELKRDMETSLLANHAAVAGNDTTARELAGVESWIATNESVGTSGSAPTGDGTDARTDGTQRAFTEAQLKAVLASCWDNGGNPDCMMLGSFNKQAASGFTGNATRFKGAEDSKLVASIDVYDSDFGELQIMPSRFQRSRSALILEKDMWAVSYLRDFQISDLAKTGDTQRKQILVEYTLEARSEAANGIVADLTTS